MPADPLAAPGTGSGSPEEDAPTARWPIPDYAEPPTGAWDRHRSPTGDHDGGPRWPAPDFAAGASGASAGAGHGTGGAGDANSTSGGYGTSNGLDAYGTTSGPDAGGASGGARLPRRAPRSGRPPAADDPETFTFDRPDWDDHGSARQRQDAGSSRTDGHAAPAWHDQRPTQDGRPTAQEGRWEAERPAHEGRAAWQGGRPERDDHRAAREDHVAAEPAADGFSYWQRPAVHESAAPVLTGAMTAGPGAAWGGQPGRPADPAMDDWDRPAPEEAPPPPQPAKRAREPYLDNVKFLLIALVPAGHALVPTLSAHSSRAAYLFIYVFHMPLFVIISGYLSRNFWNSNAKTNKLVDTFLVPYVIVEIGYAVLRFALGQKWSLTIIDPAWLNWYLLALLLWRLSTPVWKRMRYPLPIAVAVYLLAGLSDLPGDFSMDRFFGLMPFFVLGLWLQPRHFEMLNRVWVKILSVVVLVGAAGVAILIAPHVPLDPIYYKDSYAELHLSWWLGMAMRAGLLVAALTVSVAILALVPRRNTWFSELGTRTLYCYLLHGVPVLIAKEMGWLSFPWLYGPLGVMAIMCSAFALAILLCLPETRTVFKWLLEPRLVWLYRRPSGQARQAAS
ncbi:hypothetical protein Sme01_24610 [Sphaerisporangium melleum]|uniref:Acyltransferase 3 domain-containing protein n=1 Tax=Sphaerisporangium melleum TaxID=321316 RepID=A0A917QS99_9ACTN|nr:acyltransferase family protein [Sphaerisporangium melleum]GGK65228.1 hypothetical protein GCM10007964_05320 [Sphaerisporangium melleum]GII69985.1 hypothetical protein Sme01_24610 [Sphaerisporangium melleum]